MRRLINQPKERTETLVLALNGDSGDDADQQVFAHADTHLWTDGHVEIGEGNFFVELDSDEISGSRNHVMDV